MAIIKDERTKNLGLPLPYVRNDQADDCQRIAESFEKLDESYGEVRMKAATAARDSAGALELAGDAKELAQGAAIEASGALGAANTALETAGGAMNEAAGAATDAASALGLSNDALGVARAAGSLADQGLEIAEGAKEKAEEAIRRVSVLEERGGANLATPSILFPAQGADFYIFLTRAALKVRSSAFQYLYDQETHIASDWIIRNADGGIVAEARDSSDLTEHTFANLTLPAGEYALACRQKSAISGWTAWSAPVGVTLRDAPPLLTAPSGRQYHVDENGCPVMHYYYQGQHMHLRIAPAKNRAALRQTFPELGFGSSFSISYPNTSSPLAASQAAAASLTDARIDEKYSVRNEPDARSMADLAIAAGDKQGAFAHCRNLAIGGENFDLVTGYQILRLYSDAAFIDSLDATVAEAPEKKLEGWFTGFSQAQSSAWICQRGWDFVAGGFHADNNTSLGVIPVRELANYI